MLLEQTLDQLALLAHFAHAVEELGLDRIAAGAFGQIEQGIIDILEQRADETIDALERNAADQFEQITEAIRAAADCLALLQVDNVGVFGGGHG